jgi:hypothetical protein
LWNNGSAVLPENAYPEILELEFESPLPKWEFHEFSFILIILSNQHLGWILLKSNDLNSSDMINPNFLHMVKGSIKPAPSLSFL